MGQYYETFDRPFFLFTNAGFNALNVNDRAYERDDLAIAEALRRRFSQLAGIDTTQVNVSVKEGTIRLEGYAASAQVCHFLGRVADRILGARGIVNQLDLWRSGAVASPLVPSSLPTSATPPHTIDVVQPPAEV